MAGRREGKANWLNYYPIEERLIAGTDQENMIFMVAVEGGQHHDLRGLRNEYGNKDLSGRLILQDLMADSWEDSTAAFESMLHNIFGTQPVKG